MAPDLSRVVEQQLYKRYADCLTKEDRYVAMLRGRASSAIEKGRIDGLSELGGAAVPALMDG